MATVRFGDFEWDAAKARANLKKHGVSFDEATTVFLDELATPLEDRAHAERLVLIGESALGRIVLVVFAEKMESGILRIISARRATPRERKSYEED